MDPVLVILGAIVAGSILIFLIHKLSKWSDAYAERRAEEKATALEEEAAAIAEREALEENERRLLQEKRAQFSSLRSQTKVETQFLDRAYREQYAYTHYDDVMKREREYLQLYKQWEDDPDFKAGLLTNDDECAEDY